MAKKQARAPEVLPAVVVPEAALEAFREDDGLLRGFLVNVRTFLTTATVIENEAKGKYAIARSLKPVVDDDGDEYMQRFILDSKAVVKQAEEHWGICQTVSRFHKKLTAGRERAVNPAAEAAAIAQGLHNDYAREKKRRADAEQARLRQAAEDQARRDREKELADLEAAAVAAEEASAGLSQREQNFVTVLVEHGKDANRAAEVAGYKEPFKAAARLLSLPKIMQAIEGAQAAKANREQAAALKVAPVVPVNVPTVSGGVPKVGTDVTYWSATVTDEQALIMACLHGDVPRDILTINPAKVNEYARSLKQLMQWPGVTVNSDTRTRGR